MLINTIDIIYVRIYIQADATLEMAERHFSQASLEYVFLLQQVQERKKFEFVETVMANLIMHVMYEFKP